MRVAKVALAVGLTLGYTLLLGGVPTSAHGGRSWPIDSLGLSGLDSVPQAVRAVIHGAKLRASDGAAFDRFGLPVAVSGDTAVVGARSDDTPAGTDAGSVYVFVRSGTAWTEQAHLTAPDGAAYDSFGYSVAVSGDMDPWPLWPCPTPAH